jgi:ATP-dependent DNA helicase RecG
MKLENKFLEFKETKTKTYLKTVSAFANYNDGEIRFGVDNNGQIKPIEDMNAFALDIENQINDSFNIRPNYSIVQNSNKTISLFIKKGFDTPYLYNGKAYQRNDTSTIEVDRAELKRLYMQGNNVTFDEVAVPNKDLSFEVLKEKLFTVLQINSFNDDILKSLNLFKNDSYNNAALLISDKNDFSGLDIAVFGSSIDIIKERHTLSGTSLISQFDKAMEIFNRLYTFEQIDGATRVKKERIPLIAFREMIANAIVHRLYDVKINTKVSMFDDRIEISSPGGLMYGIDKEKFLTGAFSMLRNPIIANIFNRIKIIEAFATGIKRTNNVYSKYLSKPTINVDDFGISVVLPTIDFSKQIPLKYDNYLKLLNPNIKYTRSELENIFNLQKDSLLRLLNNLIEEGLLTKEGSGRATKYFIK